MKSIVQYSVALLFSVSLLANPDTLFSQVSRGDCPFYEEFRLLSLKERETLTTEHILAGNVPDYMKGFIRIRTVQKDVQGRRHRLTLWVKPHYLTVLSGGVPFIVPLTPMTAHKIANALDCSLPTPKIVDIIYEHAQVTPEPFNYIPRIRN